MISTIVEAYSSVRQVEHNIKWWAVIAAISVYKLILNYQISPFYSKQKPWIRKSTSILGYTVVIILLLTQFGPYVKAFWLEVFEYIDGLF
jgi:hypothetical protein